MRKKNGETFAFADEPKPEIKQPQKPLPEQLLLNFYKNGANRPSPQNNSINTPLTPSVPTGKT